MLEYKTIRGTDPNTFDDVVNAHIEKGYALHGGIAISAFSDRTGMTCLLVQAMTREIEAKTIVNATTFDSK
jgi:hypothetical protein